MLSGAFLGWTCLRKRKGSSSDPSPLSYDEIVPSWLRLVSSWMTQPSSPGAQGLTEGFDENGNDGNDILWHSASLDLNPTGRIGVRLLRILGVSLVLGTCWLSENQEKQERGQRLEHWRESTACLLVKQSVCAFTPTFLSHKPLCHILNKARAKHKSELNCVRALFLGVLTLAVPLWRRSRSRSSCSLLMRTVLTPTWVRTKLNWVTWRDGCSHCFEIRAFLFLMWGFTSYMKTNQSWITMGIPEQTG